MATIGKTSSTKENSESAFVSRRISPRAMIGVALAFTVVIGVALGVGLGYGLKKRESNEKLSPELVAIVTATALPRCDIGIVSGVLLKSTHNLV